MPGKPGAKADRSPVSPDEHPLFFAFGRLHDFLTAEEAATRTPEERIQSIWPFIINQARRFADSLHPRERCNNDAEDAISEIWLALRERDHKWDPAKGEYISFAGPIIHNCLYRLREESRTVPSPRNTSCRLRSYREADEMGTLSEAQAKTREDIHRTISGTCHFEGADPALPARTTVAEEVETNEHYELHAEAMRQAVESLTLSEAAIVGFIHGLWGNEKKPISQIARESGRTSDQVRRIKHRAYSKILEFLEVTRHPITKKDFDSDEPDYNEPATFF